MFIHQEQNSMQIIGFDEFAEKKILKNIPVSVTIGVFDGVHAGHMELLKRISSRAGTKSLVITFRNNPKQQLSHRAYIGSLTTVNQRLKYFSELSIDYAVMIDFSREFSRLDGKSFMRKIADSCRMEYMCIGRNFHCGYGGTFSALDTQRFLSTFYHIPVEIISSLVYDKTDIVISSTYIRSLIQQGNICLAESLMDRAFSLDLSELKQHCEGNAIYIHKDDIIQVLPPPGTYDVHITPEVEDAVSFRNRYCLLQIEEDRIACTIDAEKKNNYRRIEYADFICQGEEHAVI